MGYTKQGVSLPADAHADFKARADQAGMTLTAWLVEAGRERALRESMAAYTRLVTDPDVAEQLAAFHQAGAPARALMAAQVAALGEAA